ncbi:hypothetical protein BJF85_04335 [Saccharomonospora sp. CUA-673]|uniref:aldehyde dehydrogenase family protein n=1 Tax=Saccharomonospora sp. CUA-673 TaxID=1904969 RepID=UPI000964EB86|nr:aldehyde dehydrogenase family protein [Saccharomonospora sp. CUA-673]OLT41663.1 hypothetical protein BJF85_04335 [Saccharomonospora sp. CUA-673]
MDVEAQKPDCSKNFIGGQWRDPAQGEYYTNEDPARQVPLGEVAIAGEADVDHAVHAAREALNGKSWGRMSPADRGRLLWRIGQTIRERGEYLALLESLDTGKPYTEALHGDIPHAAGAFEYYAGWSNKITGEVLPIPSSYVDYTRHEPLGVVGAIVPWNFPLQMAAAKIAPALATGNTVLLKPAEQTPLTAMALADILSELDVPPGVVNVLPGFAATGAALVAHPGIDKITFTGSTAVGKSIMRTAADTLKRISLELGGKSPNLVFDDADLQRAVRGVATGIYYNQGEMCTAGSRVLVQDSIYDQFMDAFLAALRDLQPGDPLDKNTRLGSLVSQEQFARVSHYVTLGQQEGATLALGGAPGADRGYFFPPTVFTEVQPHSRLAQEEIFGPVVAITRFADEAQALTLANDVNYGLAAGVWTTDLARAHRVAHGLQTGTVWVNTYNALWHEAPFGGYKESGHGREGGRAGAELYTQTKNVCIRI